MSKMQIDTADHAPDPRWSKEGVCGLRIDDMGAPRFVECRGETIQIGKRFRVVYNIDEAFSEYDTMEEALLHLRLWERANDEAAAPRN